MLSRQAPALLGRLVSAAGAARHAASGALPLGAHAGAAAAVTAANATSAAASATIAPLSTLPPTRGFAASAAAGPTIFDKLGGKAAVTAAVDLFYKKVLADDTVNKFFENVPMDAQRRKQVQFLSFALGGPEGYKGRDMFEAHKHMDLKEEHFNAIAKHLVDTLNELGVKKQYVDEAMAVVATTKDAVLKQGEYAGRN